MDNGRDPAMKASSHSEPKVLPRATTGGAPDGTMTMATTTTATTTTTLATTLTTTTEPRRIRSLCVFCGSSMGKDPRYEQDARQLGRLLVEREIALVYGGGNTGLMRAVAETVRQAGQKVVGIIPHALTRT